MGKELLIAGSKFVFREKIIDNERINRMAERSKGRLPDINRFMSELYESFSIITDLEQLKDNFSARLKDVFGTQQIYIFLLHPDLNRFLPVDSLAQSGATQMTSFFQVSDRLIFWLSVNKTFLDLSKNKDVFTFLTERERTMLVELNVGLIYPFIVMNQVKGLVCIGKNADQTFLSGNLLEMKVLLDQAGFAFENAYHYTLQKERTRKMYRTDRLATLGELAAGAAHEIRNPLTSIRSSIQYLKKKLKNQADINMADGLITEVDRINEIIEGMLSFAKPREPKKESVNLRLLLTQVLQLVTNTSRKKGTTIDLNYNSDKEEILADPDQLKQVFLNILLNAVQSINHQEGLIHVRVNDVRNPRNYPAEPNTFIIEIEDNGAGIDPACMEKIFDPFFTTKSEGTGLGLSITYGIISRHGGDIELASEHGKGTKVKIKLPG